MSKNSPPLTSLYLYLTDCCNLRCSHCWISPRISSRKVEGIPLVPLKKTISAAKALGLSAVKLTGGEPLLYRDLESLLSFLKTEALTVSIETNGTLISKSMSTLLKRNNVSQISVSLDAATEAIHDDIRGEAGCCSQTVRGIERLRRQGLNTQIIMVIQKKNRNEIPEMLEFCDDLGVSCLKINHLLPCGRGEEAFSRNENLDLDSLIERYQWVEGQKRRFPQLEIVFDLPVAFRSINEITGQGISECRIHNILGILSNGDYCICGIGQTVPELRIGNIQKDDISDIWEQSPILKTLHETIPDRLAGICGDCIFKFQCLGCCRANAYAVSGNLYAPYFLGQTLHEAGRFPDSRCIKKKTINQR